MGCLPLCQHNNGNSIKKPFSHTWPLTDLNIIRWLLLLKKNRVSAYIAKYPSLCETNFPLWHIVIVKIALPGACICIILHTFLAIIFVWLYVTHVLFEALRVDLKLFLWMTQRHMSWENHNMSHQIPWEKSFLMIYCLRILCWPLCLVLKLNGSEFRNCFWILTDLFNQSYLFNFIRFSFYHLWYFHHGHAIINLPLWSSDGNLDWFNLVIK